jgi:outer membrane protein OmpA-like peptidoglycan-associated protein
MQGMDSPNEEISSAFSIEILNSIAAPVTPTPTPSPSPIPLVATPSPIPSPTPIPLQPVDFVINFGDGWSTTPTKESESTLDDMAQLLNARDGYKVIIEGYASLKKGETLSAQGRKVAEDRAKAVMQKMIDRGISPSRMTAVCGGGIESGGDFYSESNRITRVRFE